MKKVLPGLWLEWLGFPQTGESGERDELTVECVGRPLQAPGDALHTPQHPRLSRTPVLLSPGTGPPLSSLNPTS